LRDEFEFAALIKKPGVTCAKAIASIVEALVVGLLHSWALALLV